MTGCVDVGLFGQHGKLAEMGRAKLLGPATTYIHCTTLSDEEIDMIVAPAEQFRWLARSKC